MHVVSDDERREVAQRLRRAWANVPDKTPVRHHMRVLYEIYAAVGLNDDGIDAIDLFDRLADLIEPNCDREAERTCRVECSHEVEGDGCYSYFEYELTCGHEIAWGNQLPPSYCPECGRRVLYDSNDYI